MPARKSGASHGLRRAWPQSERRTCFGWVTSRRTIDRPDRPVVCLSRDHLATCRFAGSLDDNEGRRRPRSASHARGQHRCFASVTHAEIAIKVP
jgi:hypothetical protein